MTKSEREAYLAGYLAGRANMSPWQSERDDLATARLSADDYEAAQEEARKEAAMDRIIAEQKL